MKKFYVLLIAVFMSIELNAQVVVNEMMYTPTDATNEWFELYNIGPAPVNIQNWKWRDLQNAPLRTLTTQNIFIESGSYIVICQDSTKFKTQFPNVEGIYIQALGWSALNNTGNDGVILYNATDVLVDSAIYSSSWGGTGGFSLERIDPVGPSNSQSNWGSSIASDRATPNLRNSITPLSNNLFLSSFVISPPNPTVGGSIQMNLTVRNIGLNEANTFSLSIYNNPALDTNIQNSILLTSQQYTNLASGDSIVFQFNVDNLDSGLKQYIGYVFYPLDEDTTNNFLVRRVTVGGGPIVTTGLIINEIMYAPTSPELEWFEIYNNSNDEINLQNWKWKDATSTLRTITSNSVIIAPFEFAIICQDSASMRQIHPGLQGIVLQSSGWSALNNTGDDVILIAPNDTRVDSVAYLSSWGGSSRNSLERIDPARPSNDQSNWATSIACEFSTPNKTNSVTNITPYEPGDVAINEIMFDPFTGEAEWIEILNISTKNIMFNGWVIREGGNNFQLSDTCNQILPPGGYVVLSADTTIYQRFSYLREYNPMRRVAIAGSSFNLNNTGEPLVLKDAAGTVIDSVHYFANWRNPNLTSSKGVSLERINPVLGSNNRQNWSSCTSPLGGTPGERNSIYIGLPGTIEEITIAPNPFSPDGDGFDDFTIISYKFTSRFSQIRAKVFDVKGRIVRTLANNQLTGSEGQIIFNGLDDDNRKLRIGIYVVFLEAIDDQGGTIEILKAPVVIATKL